MRRIGGSRRKSRYRLKKSIRRKGKISVSRFMQKFKSGQRVYLNIEPSYHKGCYDAKYFGKMGIVKKQKGKCYEVSINDCGKEKMLIVHPLHLRVSD
jgi:large subunit ribosomal protein L21e